MNVFESIYRLLPDSVGGKIVCFAILYTVLTAVINAVTRVVLNGALRFIAIWMAFPFKVIGWAFRAMFHRNNA